MTTRTFEAKRAVRSAVPLVVGLYGPSGGGKTMSALEIATGMQRVVGGRIALIDTEGGRGLHYADLYDFDHIPFREPFGSLDYVEAIRFAASKASIVIVDSMTHEHDGPGGMLDYHEREVERMAGGDYAKAERVKMLAWQRPKADRRALLRGIVAIGAEAILILCFRAKETSKPSKDEKGKTTVVHLGFVPIGGDEFVYECTVACFLPPASDGHPNWRPEHPGERTMMKLPAQFRGLLLDRAKPLDASVGEALAQWARGTTESRAPAGTPPDRGQTQGGAPPAGARTDAAPQDPLHAEALEAVRAALRAAGATRFPQILALATAAGVDERRVTACWDSATRSLHLERLSLDELTMIVDHHERKQG